MRQSYNGEIEQMLHSLQGGLYVWVVLTACFYSLKVPKKLRSEFKLNNLVALHQDVQSIKWAAALRQIQI